MTADEFIDLIMQPQQPHAPREVHVWDKSMPGVHDMGLMPKPILNGFGFTTVHLIIVNPVTWGELEMELLRKKDEETGWYLWQPAMEKLRPGHIYGVPIYVH